MGHVTLQVIDTAPSFSRVFPKHGACSSGGEGSQVFLSLAPLSLQTDQVTLTSRSLFLLAAVEWMGGLLLGGAPLRIYEQTPLTLRFQNNRSHSHLPKVVNRSGVQTPGSQFGGWGIPEATHPTVQ